MDKTQRFFVEVEFNYVGKVYDGDPTDLEQLAALEQFSISPVLSGHLAELFPDGIENFHLKISSVRKKNDTRKNK